MRIVGGSATMDQHADAYMQRDKYVDAVVCSPARRKLIAAGPGTGKTHLFRKIVEGKAKCLTLTFVNALVEDLSRELLGLSEVKTLHGFARGQLRMMVSEDVRVYPRLSQVIQKDADVLRGERVDFDRLFHTKSELDDRLRFYRTRRRYYGHYGFSDLVYTVVLCFERNPERIPAYDQIVVDEFQDFNALEVALIELLATKSPILIVGDDDQALYESLKSASPDHIRARHAGGAEGYVSFDLPYCSRSSRVIVKAVQDIVRRSTENGLLAGRVDKPFEYFPCCEMDEISGANPHIVFCQLFDRQIPWKIQQELLEITRTVREKYTVLIISPYSAHCQSIREGLTVKGFENVQFADRGGRACPPLLDGLRLLLEDSDSNLGWRVAAEAILDGPAFEEVLRSAASQNGRMVDYLGSELKAKVREVL
ncbi:MAG: UvrD-helicase domain-containing protein, partial [Candidatus Bipolaricaulota bacterium]